MKFTSKNAPQPQVFVPLEVTFTIETQEQIDALIQLGNCITDDEILGILGHGGTAEAANFLEEHLDDLANHLENVR
ncbi:hypothetical protein N9937_00035 [bacterium]|nr:hypothetical protein [bacterium]